VDLGRTSLPANNDAPRLARAAIMGWLPSSIARRVCQDAQLLVSELVSNSVQHAGTAADAPITITSGLTDALLWFEVTDAGRDRTVTRRAPLPLNGMGLNMVDTAASRWGSTDGDGTRVWFELALKTG
jgi:anti-sigma regulatory factor (Ser/Thr protein kinase)